MADSKLLIVDDEPSMRSALARALRCQDCDITLATDGAEAVAIPERCRPVAFSVAIVDVCMPRMDGLELLIEIKRRSPATPEEHSRTRLARGRDSSARLAEERFSWTKSGIPVIFLSGLVESHQKVSGLDAGSDDYITKPFDPDELRARIRNQLRRVRQQREHLAPERAERRQLESTLNRVQKTARRCGAPLLDLDANLELAGLVRRSGLQRDLLSRAKKDVGQITRSLMRITDGLATKGNL